jgi:23S rRNA 5-hydroxycytidine C2501 synthase
MEKHSQIELLAPARDLESGLAAINHGADAVYIGAPRFGARAAAGNSLEDVATLISHAHKYWARVYITLNTLLFDHELEDAHSLITRLYEAGADALIFQDMGLLELDLPPIPLFASTQTHNYDLAKIRFLEGIGIQRVILARELSARQIAAIRETTTIELEAFIHGALCVSFSGQCYFSEVVKGRSANRGECAQMCRLPYSLIDSRGNILAENQHVLSLKDLNLSDYLSELIAAGVTSFKIEGRLKDVHYVKNITAFYRARLDAIMAGQPSLRPSSSGSTTFTFAPDPSRSFSRGFTQYFFKRRTREMVSLRTPKSLGATLGQITSVTSTSFTVRTSEILHNGDGICFFDGDDELQGVNINRVEGEDVFPNSMEGIEPGTILYRNHDHEFTRQLRGKTSARRIGVALSFEESTEGFVLLATDEDGITAQSTIAHAKVPATNADRARNTIQTQMSKMGETIFAPTEFRYVPETVYFLPISLLNSLRRSCIEALEVERAKSYPRCEHSFVPNALPYPDKTLDQYANVVNDKAEAFYRRHGVNEIARGVELQSSHSGTTLMTTKYCLKYQFDLCDGERSASEELFLTDGKRRYRLDFDCGRCVMKIVAPDDMK